MIAVGVHERRIGKLNMKVGRKNVKTFLLCIPLNIFNHFELI